MKQPAGLRLAPTARQLLLDFPFQGNIQELESVLITLYVYTKGQATAEPTDLPRRLLEPAPADHSLRLADVEREYLLRVMALKSKVVRQAAQALGIDECIVTARLRSYGEAVD